MTKTWINCHPSSWNILIRRQTGVIIEMYGRVCRVMKMPQIMGWWGIVLIQQTSAAETKLPFWRKGKSPLFPESTLRSNGSRRSCVGLMEVFVSFFFEVGDPTVWRVWGFCGCECMKISFTETARQIFIIRVSSNLNKVQFHVFFSHFPISQQAYVNKRYRRKHLMYSLE